MPRHEREILAGPEAARRLGLLRPLIAATALALVVALGWLASHATPSAEAVRLRNSLLATTGDASDFNWSPADVPASFRQQRGAAPAEFAAAAARVDASAATLERAIALVRDLHGAREHGGPIQKSTLDTYRRIVASGGGYCADYTQVFNGLAWAAGIPVREWGASFDGFGGLGHAFNEIYAPELGKWVLLDPFYAFYALDTASGRPLSVLELFERLQAPAPLETVTIVRLVPQAYDFSSDAKLLDFYRRGVDQLYLWWGNDVFDYDTQPAVRAAGAVSRSLEQLTAIVMGAHPAIRIVPTPGNAGMIAALERTRASVLWLAGASAVLLVLLAVQARLWVRLRREERSIPSYASERITTPRKP